MSGAWRSVKQEEAIHRRTSLYGFLWAGNQTGTSEAKPTLSSSEVKIGRGPLVVAGCNNLRPRIRAVTAGRDRHFNHG